MSSLAQLEELPNISYHDSWDTVKQALQNWSVRDKFTYRTPCKDDRRARYICTQPNCLFRVTGNRDRSGRITLKVVNREHTCTPRRSSNDNAATKTSNIDTNGIPLDRSQDAADGEGEEQAAETSNKDSRYRNPATQMKWLVSALENILEVTTETRPHDVQTAAKQYFNEEISYQQAFRCLRLLTADIKEHGHRERVPDEIRKAIVTLRVFVDPPMDWSEIERKTGVKARTAGYIFSSAEKKSGGSKDPFLLLKNATISATGPKTAEKSTTPVTKPPEQTQPPPSIPSEPMVIPKFATSRVITPSNFSGLRRVRGVPEEIYPRKKSRPDVDPNLDPALDIAAELARAAAQIDEEGDVLQANGMLGIHNHMAHSAI